MLQLTTNQYQKYKKKNTKSCRTHSVFVASWLDLGKLSTVSVCLCCAFSIGFIENLECANDMVIKITMYSIANIFKYGTRFELLCKTKKLLFCLLVFFSSAVRTFADTFLMGWIRFSFFCVILFDCFLHVFDWNFSFVAFRKFKLINMKEIIRLALNDGLFL